MPPAAKASDGEESPPQVRATIHAPASQPRLFIEAGATAAPLPPPGWRWAMAGSFLAAAYVGGAVGDVVGESGLVWTGGPGWVLALIAFDATSSLAAMGAVVTSLDKLQRSKLAQVVATACAASSLLLAALLGAGWVGPKTFVVITIVERLQFVAMYATALALARELFGAEVRAHTWLRAVGTTGAACGAFGASAAGTFGAKSWVLFVASTAFFCIAALVLWLGRRAPPERHQPGPPTPPPSSASSLVAVYSTPPPPPNDHAAARALRGMLADLRQSERVRRIAIIGLLNGVAYTTVAYEAARLFDQATSAGAVQARYGILRAAEPIAAVLSDLLLARWLVQKAGHFRLFAAAPLVFVVGIAALLFAPHVALVIAVASAVQVAYGVESTALSAALAPLPSGQRQRIGALLESAPYQVGYLTACFGFVILLTLRSLGLTLDHARSAWLGFGLVAASIGLLLAAVLGRTARVRRGRLDSLRPPVSTYAP